MVKGRLPAELFPFFLKDGLFQTVVNPGALICVNAVFFVETVFKLGFSLEPGVFRWN